MQIYVTDPLTQIRIALAVLGFGVLYLYYLLYKKGIVTRSEIATYFRIVSMVMPYWGQEVAKKILNDMTHYFASKWSIELLEEVKDIVEEKLEELKKLEAEVKHSPTT